MEGEDNLPASSRDEQNNPDDDGYEEDNESDAEDYLEIFDANQFMRDGNDIRYQLPSSNAGLSLGRNHDDPPKSSMSIMRR